MKKQLLFLACVIVLFGCAKNDGISPDSDDTQPKQNYEPIGRVLTADQVKSLALQIPADYSTDRATRSAAKRIKEIVPFGQTVWGTRVRTKSADADPTAEAIKDIYIVNYEDSAGFAIVSADNRLPDVLAYSDKGTLSENENLPEGVKMFLAALPDYARIEAARTDSLIAAKNRSLDSLPDPDGYYRLNPRHEWGPKMYFTDNPVIKTQWGQDRPFNEEAPIINGVRAKAGCVPVAIAQITSYHGTPVRAYDYNNIELGIYYNLNWPILANCLTGDDVFNAYMNKPVAVYLRWIGGLCNANYGTVETTAADDSPQNVFKTFGYSYKSIGPYEFKSLCLSIRRKQPAYLCGRSPDNSKGHAWVADGVKCWEQNYYLIYDLYDANMNFVRTETVYDGVTGHLDTHIYCNWGVNGTYDGFFEAGVFKPGISDFTRNVKQVIDIMPN
ncbi:MAG: hypothetical protein EGP73_07435 [Alistipes indistinctus]|uniref:C10 family peptidase n=1 Tax=Alistipes indistinctus TaxID=626932 RepID=UPI00241E344A|nr:C10 family peptidase [Alistipes indistinctus]MBD9134678.1 hypothetical protein [Alistipes indistinctus]